MNHDPENPAALTCPLPLEDGPGVLLAHGGGGTLMRKLIEEFLDAFGAPPARDRHDGAVLDPRGGRIAFTTDSFVVRPLFFPGGDIGSLSVFGTVNDLAMCGARPLWLSVGMILEEGFPLAKLREVTGSIASSAAAAGARVVTGDTKVVEKGKCDGIYINTAGIGVVPNGVDVRPSRIRPGDAIVVNGDLGRHGITIMTLREGISIEAGIESDLAPLSGTVERIVHAGIDIRCMRDLTRGGLAAALYEISSDSGLDMDVDEPSIPVDSRVRAACELLGFDPVHVANEGRFVAFVPPGQARALMDAMAEPGSPFRPSLIGTVKEGSGRGVMLRSAMGTMRPLSVLSGEQLPRIC